ncbi:MAG TPA: hypothetical protein VE866_16675 [Candidatus Binatia bacterium]|nr:hypothetical protein [Candidatus Binatia bacterium]
MCAVAVRRSAGLATISLTLFTLVMASCGTNSKTATTTPPTSTPPPAQPSYPSTPPVPITWSPSNSQLPAPPACNPATSTCTPPDPNGSNDFPLTVSSPTNNATTTSPMTVVASATPKNPIFFMRVYVDQMAMYFTYTNSINTQLFIASGQHTVEVMAEDTSGYISSTILNVNVTTQAQTTINGIQNMAGWQTCAGDFPAGSGRAGQVCASGNPNPPTFNMTQNQSSPAMDGKSAEFSISGPNAYSNQLSFNAVAGGNNVSHFIYDLYFYVDNPAAPQALEFDVNQTFGGNRWVWGSECNFKGETPPMWDLWDDASGIWRESTVPCNPFPANTWVHLIWTLERVGNQVHYISLQEGSQIYNVDTYYNNQPDWTLEEIDVAFQMDLAQPPVPYNVWLDEVNLTAY